MREIAPEVFQIPLAPREAINAYLVGDVLVDTGLKGSAKKLLGALEGRRVRALALTHAHLDHAGGAQKVVDARRIPYWVGALDAEAADTGEPVFAFKRFGGLAGFVGGFDGLQVDRQLREGDELAAGFTVLDVPGHSPGHVAFWRERDRTLIAGDVLNGMGLLTSRPGLHLPPRLFSPDPEENRRSAQKLAALSPDTVAFGHGPVMTGAAPKLNAFLSTSR